MRVWWIFKVPLSLYEQFVLKYRFYVIFFFFVVLFGPSKKVYRENPKTALLKSIEQRAQFDLGNRVWLRKYRSTPSGSSLRSVTIKTYRAGIIFKKTKKLPFICIINAYNCRNQIGLKRNVYCCRGRFIM